MRVARNIFAIFGRKRIANESGVAAVEFALLAPFLVFLYLGAVEIIQGILIQRQTTLTATTVANIVTQFTTISASTQMPDILNAAEQIFTPYSYANSKVVVSLVKIDSSGSATVSWSQTLNGTARPQGQSLTLPASLDIPNTYLVLSEVTYSYTPTIDFIHMGTKTLSASIYMSPRASTTINLTS